MIMEKARIITVLLIALSLPAPVFPAGGGDGGDGGGGEPATSIYGNSAPSAYDEGRKLTRLGNWKGAIAQFQKAVADDSKDHKAYNMLGYSLRQAGQYEAAIEAYNRSLFLKPDFAEALEYRGEAFLKMGNQKAAMQDYNALLGLGSPLAEDLKKALKLAVIKLN